jgi:hypothetical protein
MTRGGRLRPPARSPQAHGACGFFLRPRYFRDMLVAWTLPSPTTAERSKWRLAAGLRGQQHGADARLDRGGSGDRAAAAHHDPPITCRRSSATAACRACRNSSSTCIYRRRARARPRSNSPATSPKNSRRTPMAVAGMGAPAVWPPPPDASNRARAWRPEEWA